MPTYLLLIVLTFSTVCQGYAQQPDFVYEHLPILAGTPPVNENDINADVQLFSNGQFLSFVIEVRDNQVETNPGNYYTDHVEVWMALPPSSYPKEFEYQLHPHYVRANLAYRGAPEPDQENRFFSTYSEYTPKVSKAQILAGHDYPKGKDIRHDSLQVPYPNMLRDARVDYGIVHFGLFPDNRPPVWYNQESLKALEDVLNLKMGSLESGLKYTVDHRDFGYVINVQMDARALGFITTPSMPEVALAVDVIDTDFKYKRGVTILSTSQLLESDTSTRSFAVATLEQPLKTNFSKVPDQVFHQIGYFPTYVYAANGWEPIAVDTDMLFYKEHTPSASLTEVQFSRRPISYTQYHSESERIYLQKLRIACQYVNVQPTVLEYTILNGHVFKGELTSTPLSILDTTALDEEVFLFEDGKPGVIVFSNRRSDPFEWSDCAECQEQEFSIYRVDRDKSWRIFSVSQSDGPLPFCLIQNQPYNSYYVDHMNWGRKGQILVLHLQHRKRSDRKRLRISWDDFGNNIEVQELP
ncbi:MAG: hypothetical protein AAGI38_04250 [Bacteroidota bacterium]